MVQRSSRKAALARTSLAPARVHQRHMGNFDVPGVAARELPRRCQGQSGAWQLRASSSLLAEICDTFPKHRPQLGALKRQNFKACRGSSAEAIRLGIETIEAECPFLRLLKYAPMRAESIADACAASPEFSPLNQCPPRACGRWPAGLHTGDLMMRVSGSNPRGMLVLLTAD